MLTSTDVLVCQRLAKALWRRRDCPSEQQAQLCQEGLPEGAPLLLQPAGQHTAEARAKTTCCVWMVLFSSSIYLYLYNTDTCSASACCVIELCPSEVRVGCCLHEGPPWSLPLELFLKGYQDKSRTQNTLAGSRVRVQARNSLVRMEVVELLLRVFQPLGGIPVLLLQQWHDGRHVLQIPGKRSDLSAACETERFGCTLAAHDLMSLLSAQRNHWLSLRYTTSHGGLTVEDKHLLCRSCSRNLRS